MKQSDRELTPPTNDPVAAVDEDKLETDVAYRFDYVSDVIGLNEKDHEILRLHRETIEPHLATIVENVYRKMFQNDSMKRHFLSRHAGFEGNLPARLTELTLENEQTEFRKQRLQEYFVKLCTADWDDTFAVLIDVVGSMHTPREGNSTLEVPLVQVVTLLGAINDLFLETISELELSGRTKIAIQRAYTKLFWIQNCMFVRHWTS